LEFFKKFRNSDLAELLSWAQWMTVKEGETIMSESDEGLSFYIVVSGRLVAMKGKHVLTVLRAGESFGEMSYLDDESVQRGASVIARTDCELLMIDPMFLESAELMLRMEVAEALVRVQAMRLRRAMIAVVRVLDETGRNSESLYEEIRQ
jgi:CRP-like cAMP-binding protein